jgi:nitroreductase
MGDRFEYRSIDPFGGGRVTVIYQVDGDGAGPQLTRGGILKNILSIPVEIDTLPDHMSASGLRKLAHKKPFSYGYILYRYCRDVATLLASSLYDFRRVLKFSSAVYLGDNEEKLHALLIMGYHSIEKGLSLPHPRPGFGRHHVNALLLRLERYVRYFGVEDQCIVALNVLKSYYEFNKSNNIVDQKLLDEIMRIERRCAESRQCPVISAGGVKTMRAEDFYKSSRIDLSGFFTSRCSVRQYSEKKVPVAEIEKAIRMAQKAPSSCNRQSARVRLLNKQADVQDALKIQNGAQGFDTVVNTVLVVTSDLSCFQSAGERYQCWIDGGMFAMSLVFALHSLGLVSCCLNWSKIKDVDVRFKRRFSIPQSESIILLVAVGYPPDEFIVAESCRKKLERVLIVH